MSLTKYEHYQELFEASPAAFPGKLGGQHSKVWKTRRRADGKIFLAQEFCDDLDIIHDVQESLLRLLNHPNVINLVDIVKDSKNLEGGIDFAVWEWCDQGSLSRLMWHADTAKQADMPESLCWHVLSGVAKALMYLHTGVKHTFPFDRTMVQDDDWHPVMIADISPSKIYFCAPKENETYGEVKLGGFKWVTIANGRVLTQIPEWVHSDFSPYLAPELINGTHPWTTEAEIWSLGAVLYHMMVGHQPRPRDLSKWVEEEDGKHYCYVEKLPTRYSVELRKIVYDMLSYYLENRPSAAALDRRIYVGMSIWRDLTGQRKTANLEPDEKGLFNL